MVKCNTERLIRALIGAEASAGNGGTVARPQRYVVTVSRNHGAQGREIAEELAARLGVRCCDREILLGVARRANVDVELVASLDRSIQAIQGEWWRGLLSGRTISRDQFYPNLVKVILSISQKGGVILGRGAHLILAPEVAFRVRIVGSPLVCAERVAEWEGLSEEAALKRIGVVDKQRSEYIRVLYERDINDPVTYDLIINSDRFCVNAVVDMILVAMVKAGYSLPESAGLPSDS